jgi:hypothetical protein
MVRLIEVVMQRGFSLVPLATEAVSQVDFLSPKAFHNSAQGNTLGLGRAFEPTLKALNSYRMQTRK